MIEVIRVVSEARQQMKDITSEVNGAPLRRLSAKGGVCLVFVPHTTAGLIIKENADPAVCSDMLDWLDEAEPQSRPFRHEEGNTPARIKATLAGQSATLPVEDGRLALGTWQGVFLAEFDGPCERTAIVSLVPGT